MILALLACGFEVPEVSERAATPRSVVVSTRAVPPGTPLSADDVAVVELPSHAFPDGPTFAALADVLGRTPIEAVVQGEPIRAERLANPDPSFGLGAIVVPGKRAVALPLGHDEGWFATIPPGAYVDLAWTPDPQRTRDPASDGTKTVVQQLKVLAVGDALLDSDGAQHGSVVLELTPDEARQILLARASGRILLSLRSDLDVLMIEQRAPVDRALLRGE